MDRRVTAGIYILKPAGDARISPADSFSAISNVEEDRREIEILDADVRIHRLARRRGVWTGEFLRRQTENIPPKAFARGGVAPLGLGRDEGLGHGAAFVFHPSNKVLVWENVRTGASLSRFSAYLEHFSGGGSFEISPSLTREAMVKLNHARVKRLRIRVADPANLRTFDNTQKSLKDAMRLLERLTNGAFVEIEVGAERGSNSFLGSAAREAMKWLVNEAEEQRGSIQKLQIDGRTDDDSQLAMIDLLHDRMKATKTLDIDGYELDANYERRLSWLRTVYGNYSDDIDRMYGESEER